MNLQDAQTTPGARRLSPSARRGFYSADRAAILRSLEEALACACHGVLGPRRSRPTGAHFLAALSLRLLTVWRQPPLAPGLLFAPLGPHSGLARVCTLYFDKHRPATLGAALAQNLPSGPRNSRGPAPVFAPHYQAACRPGSVAGSLDSMLTLLLHLDTSRRKRAALPSVVPASPSHRKQLLLGRRAADDPGPARATCCACGLLLAHAGNHSQPN